MGYDFRKIEQKWQRYWRENKTFKAYNDSEKPKYYVLDMFPYPSGAGLHVGHPLGYIASDIYARYKRHLGFNVLHPMGFDAYGLPAEQYAIQTGTHPEVTTNKNIDKYREQLDHIGFSYDWDREVRTSDPQYYKWTQWTFIQLFKSWYNNDTDKAESIDELIARFEKEGNRQVNASYDPIDPFTAEEWNRWNEVEKQENLMHYRLAYLSDTMVNWCPDLGTVLANDEVKDGFSERGGHPVEKKLMKQWSLRITAYSERLLDGLDKIDWSDNVKEMQRNWIGRSEGASVVFSLSPALSKGEGVVQRYQTADKKIWSFLKESSREHRHNQTEAEEKIWQRLRAKRIGFKIRRQHAIGTFIPDFVCLGKQTVIEIDGEIHKEKDQKEYDEFRTKQLEELGFSVIRFTNEEVLNNIDKVILSIKNYLDTKVVEPDSNSETVSAPSPQGEGRNETVSAPSPQGEGRGGAIDVFTTRPDTLFGATFMVLAPEHELIEKITTPEQKEEVDKYVSWAKNRSERERMTEVKTVTGVFTGTFAINPLNGEEIPIWTADYVLSGYGTGAIMAVPGHDSRDFAFARHFKLLIIQVVVKENEEPTDPSTWDDSYDSKEGIMINSGFINGLQVNDAIRNTIEELENRKIGFGQINFRLRDAIFSRQRYWGEPFPMYYKNGMPYPLDESELPLKLPPVDKYLPTEDGEPPLARAKNWKTKEGYPLETNTMPGFAGSSGYYLRYMDPQNEDAYFSKEANNYWKDIDLYLGGDEHSTGHLIYSRFWNKFLYDLGMVVSEEPFKKLINQGKIQGRSSFVYRVQGTNQFVSYNLRKQYQFQALHVDIDMVDGDILDTEAFKNWRSEFKDAEFILEDGEYICGHEVEKMSKSKLNTQSPDDLIHKYGADTLRLYEMFLGPLEQHKPWDTKGIEGVFRFLHKLWRLFYDNEDQLIVDDNKATEAELKVIHKTIKKIRSDIERFSFNTGVSAFMICVNELSELKCHKREILEKLVILLAPYAPHIAEEIWDSLGHTHGISHVDFPQYDNRYLVESTFAYPVSFNGKMRFKLELPIDMPVPDVQKQAVEAEEAQRWLEGKSVKKVIVVPKRIINIVIS